MGLFGPTSGGGGVAGVSSISVNGGGSQTGAVSLTVPTADFRRFIIPESDVQLNGAAAPDISVATIPVNTKFLVTRFSVWVVTAQTTIGASTLTGPTVRLICGPVGGTINVNAFPSMVINSTVNAVNDVQALSGSGTNDTHRVLSDAAGVSLVVRCTVPGTRYTNFRASFIVEGFYL